MQPTGFPKNPLRRPFPDREFGRAIVFGHARTALFVFLALYFLRPLGLQFGENALWISVGYAGVTFAIAVAYSWFTNRVLGWRRTGEDWTLGRWILDCAGVLFFITVGNFVYYNALVDWSAFSLLVFGSIALPTIAIGLFPIAFSGMALQLRAERDNQRTASSLSRITGRFTPAPSAPRLTDLADNLSLDPGNILFCEARQNYVRVGYLREGHFAEETIRATLAETADKLSNSTVIRCHRSYLVNTDHIAAVRGNAQGLKVNLVGTEEEVPVSRSYVGRVREYVLS
ncbi:LytTR family DNA-binding domain-containing protein [Neolewinella antarctica]|uniref:DNA-binding LytR/AlgR family response regulator n=1 Tax=Neolewinella antarctica TaxID=442734 RepID=A0ABX0X9I1_9BACT|nr:LytTR family DNA-binding domain-containing protein [Neolewinella antarctica]NJC25670.1 DNA-binding LytR/AlgR family response regulator [Neolewinella antarctica]